ncbi:hypothetical protein F5Y01DRAFT_315884 [Xylaria sp. FL0043]|nr:hypothetical protein F5Y01DRAFT_315884 [Xylaria sp. FL0043]
MASATTSLVYEVVLADGRIVIAEATGNHPDLFRVLEGGGTMKTTPSGPLWGGFTAHSMDVLPHPPRSSEDPDSTLNFTMCHIHRLGGTAVVAICVNVAGVENPPAFAQFSKTLKLMDNLKPTSLSEVPTDLYVTADKLLVVCDLLSSAKPIPFDLYTDMLSSNV